MTASAEVAHPISDRLPSVWWAAFVDAGSAADRWVDLDPVLGYGLGLRWRSPSARCASIWPTARKSAGPPAPERRHRVLSDRSGPTG
jgi:outer membrane protein assembly factor BamA